MLFGLDSAWKEARSEGTIGSSSQKGLWEGQDKVMRASWEC